MTHAAIVICTLYDKCYGYFCCINQCTFSDSSNLVESCFKHIVVLTDIADVFTGIYSFCCLECPYCNTTCRHHGKIISLSFFLHSLGYIPFVFLNVLIATPHVVIMVRSFLYHFFLDIAILAYCSSIVYFPGTTHNLCPWWIFFPRYGGVDILPW